MNCGEIIQNYMCRDCFTPILGHSFMCGDSLGLAVTLTGSDLVLPVAPVKNTFLVLSRQGRTPPHSPVSIQSHHYSLYSPYPFSFVLAQEGHTYIPGFPCLLRNYRLILPAQIRYLDLPYFRTSLVLVCPSYNAINELTSMVYRKVVQSPPSSCLLCILLENFLLLTWRPSTTSSLALIPFTTSSTACQG